MLAGDKINDVISLPAEKVIIGIDSPTNIFKTYLRFGQTILLTNHLMYQVYQAEKGRNGLYNFLIHMYVEQYFVNKIGLNLP